MLLFIDHIADHQGHSIPSLVLDVDENSFREHGNLALVLYKALCRPILPHERNNVFHHSLSMAERLLRSSEANVRIVHNALKDNADFVISGQFLEIRDTSGPEEAQPLAQYINDNLSASHTLRLGLDYAPMFSYVFGEKTYLINTKALTYSFFTCAKHYLDTGRFEQSQHALLLTLGHNAQQEVLDREQRDMPNITDTLGKIKRLQP